MVHVQGSPEPELYWLLAEVQAQIPFHIGVVHAPWSIYLGRLEYYAALLHIAETWEFGPGVVIGDTNTGITGKDEETEDSEQYKERYMYPLEALGWRDMFRAFHPDADAPTWYSPSNNGRRLDQAFVNAELQATVTACDYSWGDNDKFRKPSDHAAILLELNGLGGS